jgi:hypothetical protein
MTTGRLPARADESEPCLRQGEDPGELAGLAQGGDGIPRT